MPVAAIVLSLAAIEVLLRWTEDVAYEFRVADAELGWTLRPGGAAWSDGEQRVWLSINSDGMRDEEHPIVAPPDTIRIAVLGDSYMQGVNVDASDMFTTVLEQHLQRCVAARLRLEVLNFGVSGYGTAQQLLQYRRSVVKYRPDVVVVAMYLGNDVYNNHPELDESIGIKPPYFVVEHDRLVPFAQPQPRTTELWHRRARSWVTDRFVSAAMLYHAYAAVRGALIGDVAIADVSNDGWSDIFKEPSTQAHREAWMVTEALLRTLAGEVRAAGSEFWLATLSIAEQTHSDPGVRAAFAASLGVRDLFYPDRRVREFAAANGIPIISLAEPLAAYARDHGVPLNQLTATGELGHWTPAGYRLAATLVADRLCRDSAVAHR